MNAQDRDWIRAQIVASRRAQGLQATRHQRPTAEAGMSRHKRSGRRPTPVDRSIRPEELERMATPQDRQKAQRPAEPRRPVLARTRTDRLKRQMLGMDKAGHPCACDDKTPCLAHAGITGRRRWLRPRQGGRGQIVTAPAAKS